MNNDTLCYPQYQNPPQQVKKKRNQPGNPDPEAEVIALSPKTLLATNRFFCEICNKGFQRDQNLQLHRRGHNLPWKLKKRENKDLARKKVYVCPESSCVHHDPSRALGDLTGIKKHFSRKHGEKKWKCEKCSKRYAVQSDCKAHFKICGTREYKCECGTIFSRRDSFITHRAFCETLAVESARSANPTIFSSQMNLQFQQPQYFNRHLPAATLFSTKKEQQPISTDHFRHTEIPPWLMTTNSQQFQLGAANISGPPSVLSDFNSSSIFPANQQYTQSGHKDLNLHDHNPNPNIRGPISSRGESGGAVHISATALLQKSADLFGATTISNKTSSAVTGPGSAKIPHNTHESVTSTTAAKQTAQNLSSREELMTTTTSGPGNISGMMTSFSNFANAFEGSTFEDALLFGGFTNLNSKKEVDDDDDQQQLYFNEEDHMTKDFLGLRTLSHTDDIFNNIAGLPPKDVVQRMGLLLP